MMLILKFYKKKIYKVKIIFIVPIYDKYIKVNKINLIPKLGANLSM